MSYLGTPETYYGDDAEYGWQDFEDQERYLTYIFEHEAVVGVLELDDSVTNSDEVLALVRMGDTLRWYDNQDLHRLVSVLEEVDNAPFWVTLVRDWFEKGGK